MPVRKPLSLFEKHRQTWSGCAACELSARRTKVVIARGRVPADILFVGEGPGVSEDLLSQPFVGPAGRLLDMIVDKSLGRENVYRVSQGMPALSRCFTNLVCCIPLNKDGKKDGDLDDGWVQSCAPRLIEFVEICDPVLIVCVGAQARDWLDDKYSGRVRLERNVPHVHIDHPSYMLRSHTVNREFLIQKAVVNLSTAFSDLTSADVESQEREVECQNP